MTSEEVAVRYLGDMQRIELKPGDKLVIKYAGFMSTNMVRALREHLETHFPGHDVIILSEGMELGVLGSAESGARS